MFSNLSFRKILTVSLLVGIAFLLQVGVVSAANEPDNTGDGVEVLTRGPIHEAFADVSVDATQTTAVVPRPVPEPINEIPPEYRPEGEHIEWIPGYWSWDEEQDNFIWVSGVWRDVPPGRQWVPGYWQPVAGGTQYISGYWASIEQPEPKYLPPPPQPLVAGPNSPALTPYHVWIEGNWIWSRNGYAWQPGYWHEQRSDMVWIPGHYTWTPRGYIFVMGYWDYQLTHRGVLFAPLFYPRPIYRHHGYYYRPAIVLDIDSIFLSLFIRTNSRHYYFGDYYDSRYEKRGFHPWYSKNATRYGHDPYYRSYRASRLRHDKNWEKNYFRQFEYRRDHKDARPPHVYRPQSGHNQYKSNGPQKPTIGRPLVDVVENRQQPIRFTRVKPDHKQEFQFQKRQTDRIQRERKKPEIVPVPVPTHVPAQRQKSWIPTESKKPVQIQKTATPIKNKPVKPTTYTKKERNGENNRHGKPVEQIKNQPQVKAQSNQQKYHHLKQQNKPENLQQAKPRGKQYQQPPSQTVTPPAAKQQKKKYLEPMPETEEQRQLDRDKRRYKERTTQ